MANVSKTRDPYDRGNGLHGVPIYRIAAFALNNSSTNLYLFFMGYVAYYLNGFVGMATIMASSFSTFMRIWDGVTDPFVGYIVDKTDGKLGKNRPFIIIGHLILLVTSFILFHVTHKLPEGIIRTIFFIVMSMIYYVGYTFQCVVTKSAQTCLTNDPKQRPLFAMFDAIYNTFLFTIVAIIVAKIVAKYDGNFIDVRFFHDFWVFTAISAFICMLLAVWAIWPKDQTKYFGTGKAVKVSFKDYFEVIAHNRAIQMLVVNASTDKLASSAKTSAVTAVMFGVVCGNFALYGAMSAYTLPFTLAFIVFGIGGMATKMGMKRAMIVGSVGGLVTNALLILLWLFGDPTTLAMPGVEGFSGLTFFTVALILLTALTGGFQAISGNIVIPMTADCADYEVYRSGRYVPGLMGTLFSFVDKLISSLAPLLAGVVFAAVGYADALPTAASPYSDGLKYAGIFLMYGMLIFGLLCNLIAMKFYPLSKEKMESIQDEIRAIKEKAMKEA
ncbi:MAG: MFS transporter [bacterium]|nr:MFS transporter [bacterium]